MRFQAGDGDGCGRGGGTPMIEVRSSQDSGRVERGGPRCYASCGAARLGRDRPVRSLTARPSQADDSRGQTGRSLGQVHLDHPHLRLQRQDDNGAKSRRCPPNPRGSELLAVRPQTPAALRDLTRAADPAVSVANVRFVSIPTSPDGVPEGRGARAEVARRQRGPALNCARCSARCARPHRSRRGRPARPAATRRRLGPPARRLTRRALPRVSRPAWLRSRGRHRSELGAVSPGDLDTGVRRQGDAHPRAWASGWHPK